VESLGIIEIDGQNNEEKDSTTKVAWEQSEKVDA
jgi:hypothetical protein